MPAGTRAMLSFTAAPRAASPPATAPPPSSHHDRARRSASTHPATPASANTIASLSTCAPATSTCKSSGLAVHNSAARSWAARLPRVIRCSSRPVAAKASAVSTDPANTVSRTEVPPAADASACSPEARLPYTDGLPRQSCTARATGSPSRASMTGVVV